jgi:hypothetical protein
VNVGAKREMHLLLGIWLQLSSATSSTRQ